MNQLLLYLLVMASVFIGIHGKDMNVTSITELTSNSSY